MVKIKKKPWILLVVTQLSLLPLVQAAEQTNPLFNTLEPLDCVINPSVISDLGSSVQGVLQSVEVDRGDFVKAGDIIAVLESSVDQASLDLARARVELTAEIDLRRINAGFGERQSKRMEDLYSREMISSKEMDQTQTESKLTQLQLNQALDNKKIAELELARAQEIVDRHTIRSPITGFIMERFKTLGEYVDDQPIVRVAQLSPLHVEVILPVGQLGAVHKGMMAEVWADTLADKWQAKVSRIDRVADVASGTYGVRLSLANQQYKIPAGLRCRVSFKRADKTAPKKATKDQDTGSNTALLAAETAPAAKPEKSATTPSSANLQAGWLGPFVAQSAAQLKATEFKNQGKKSYVEKRITKVKTGTLVISPPFDSKSQVSAYLKHLKVVGDKDHYQLRHEKGQPYYVALGLHTNPERAKRRVDELQDKGFVVHTQERFEQQQGYWVSVEGEYSPSDVEVEGKFTDNLAQ